MVPFLQEVILLDLFDGVLNKKGNVPLADRMRPNNLEEFIGQREILGPGKLLRKAIEEDKIGSIIFYGPPGTGKTTLAHIIARRTNGEFKRINAVTSGVKEIREIIAEAERKRKYYCTRTILFIDEIHRFNKAQQDALLPAVENGIITLIGATTENPYFEINSPLVSRTRVFALNPLQDDDVVRILQQALKDEGQGLGSYDIKIEEAALYHLAKAAGGDARRALNALEAAFLNAPKEGETYRLTLPVIEDSLQKRAINYDKTGDQHYDTISAFIKSMRGSDPDATIYWLAKMIKAGEDPKFIARRIMVHAAEDIGLADPQALVVATAAAQAVERVGLPEGRIILAEAALYIATAPKSNAVIKAIDGALKFIEQNPRGSVPAHLKDASYRGAEQLGHGKGYRYPHDYPESWVKQNYLPQELSYLRFYTPTCHGKEAEITQFLKEKWTDEGE